jgi:kynurenine formamidase
MKFLSTTLLCGLGVVIAVPAAVVLSQPKTSRAPVSPEQYERWKTELSNWGRWGKDDQLGALNLITPAKRKAAASLVRDGVSVSLARVWEKDDRKDQAVDVTNPYEHSMHTLGTDRVAVDIHGQATTHYDSLSHIALNGKGYNGYTPDEKAVMKDGHPRNSVNAIKNGVFTRGILMDIPRLKGVPYLEPGTPIYAEDLEAWEKRAGVKVGPGDALFIRTGRWARRAAVGPWYPGRAKNGIGAGLDASVLPWLKSRDVALLGADASPYLQPAPEHLRGAVHDFSISIMGVAGIDICDLEALSAAAAERNRWEFLLTAAPLPIRGATGSPINPIATF